MDVFWDTGIWLLRGVQKQKIQFKRALCENRFDLQQVSTEPPPSALNMTLPAFAAERRRMQHGARSAPAAIDTFCPHGA